MVAGNIIMSSSGNIRVIFQPSAQAERGKNRGNTSEKYFNFRNIFVIFVKKSYIEIVEKTPQHCFSKNILWKYILYEENL